MFTVRLPRHQYSARLMRLFLDAVLRCATSQRATAGFLKLVSFWLPGVEKTPCPNTGRMWLLRLGLHESGLDISVLLATAYGSLLLTEMTDYWY